MVPNGCVRPVLRPEKSRGCKLGAMGNVAASSAQSKRGGTGVELSSTGLEEVSTRYGGRETAVAGGSDMSAVVEGAGGGETARLRLSWGEPGWMGSERGIRGERGASVGADSVVGDAGGVCQTDDAETARLRGVWGDLGGWNELWGRSDGSGSMSRRS
jgi:hypothetical protein